MIPQEVWEYAAASGIPLRWTLGPRPGRGTFLCDRESTSEVPRRARLRVHWFPNGTCEYTDHELITVEANAWLDEDGRLHREDGPAIEAAWAMFWYVHGVAVESWVVTNPERITPDLIMAERNAETRRVMRERFGTLRFLTEIGATVLDADTVPLDAAVPGGPFLARALLADDLREHYLVATDGSTSRVHVMRVPRIAKTCRDAYDALSGRRGARTIVEA